MAKSHYLNKCWLINHRALWYSTHVNFIINAQDINHLVVFWNYSFIITTAFAGATELILSRSMLVMGLGHIYIGYWHFISCQDTGAIHHVNLHLPKYCSGDFKCMVFKLLKLLLSIRWETIGLSTWLVYTFSGNGSGPTGNNPYYLDWYW